MESTAQRQKRLTRDFARRIVEAKEKYNAPNAKEWRKAYDKAQTDK